MSERILLRFDKSRNDLCRILFFFFFDCNKAQQSKEAFRNKNQLILAIFLNTKKQISMIF